MKTKLLVISFGIVTILLAAFFITFSCSELEDATSTAGGGFTLCTDTNATGITTAEELQAVKDTLAGNFCLNQDINLSTIADFEPIGTPSTPFTGTLDGNSKKITNLTINRPTESQIGLFGETSTSATIKDLTVENATIVGNQNTGILIGKNKANITNVSITGTSSVEGKSFSTGAIAGNNVSATITNCNSNASVTGTSNAGGLVGDADNATITNSYASGIVDGSASFIGGLVGMLTNTSISKSYATGNTTGLDSIGGLIGSIEGGNNAIEDSYSTGSVTGSTTTYLGGFVGKSYNSTGGNTINRCYSTGMVSSGNGGFIGDPATITAVSDNYFDTVGAGTDNGSDTSNRTGITGIVVGDIGSGGASPFQSNNWDFTTVWNAEGTGTWPTLK